MRSVGRAAMSGPAIWTFHSTDWLPARLFSAIRAELAGRTWLFENRGGRQMRGAYASYEIIKAGRRSALHEADSRPHPAAIVAACPVDSSVLLDIFTSDPARAPWTVEWLERPGLKAGSSWRARRCFHTGRRAGPGRRLSQISSSALTRQSPI